MNEMTGPMTGPMRGTVEQLAARLGADDIDWEPRVREQPFRPARRAGRVGL